MIEESHGWWDSASWVRKERSHSRFAVSWLCCQHLRVARVAAYAPRVRAPPPLGAENPPVRFRDTLNEVIFGTETRAGKAFDVALLVVILLSIGVVVLDSVPSFHDTLGPHFRRLEFLFTGLFTVEYGLRIYSARERVRYVLSFYGLVDLLALLPTYFSLALGGLNSLLIIRVLRLLRVFRVLKVVRMLTEADELARALRASLPKVTVFLGFVLTLVVVIGAAMHLIEGAEHGFTSIPRSMYWAIVTLTTVGYGDIAPATTLGQVLASVVMILGYGVLAVPTGIVSVELAHIGRSNDLVCARCAARGHATGSRFCRMCGQALSDGPEREYS